MQYKTLPSWIIWTLAVISFIGFLDATHLTVAHYSGSELNCRILEGCNEVANSRYATILGIPIALFGSIYYITVLLLTLLFYDTKNKIILNIIPLITSLGFIFTLWLVYLQIFVIEAICIYCMVSALTSTLLFVAGILVFRYKKKLI